MPDLTRLWQRLIRRRGVGHESDAGFTLVETLVAMIVFSIAIAMVYRALIGVQTFARDVQGSANANDQVRLAVAQIDRQVRSGNVLYSPANEPASLASCTASGTDAGSCMRVYTQANGMQRCVQWQVLADSAHPGTSLLRSRSWSPTWQTDHNYTGWAVQARGLVPTPSVPPFTLKGAVTSYSSRFLVVHFEGIDPRRPGKPVLIESSLAGRNTNYGYDGGLCSPAPPA
jgi:prepilin-type N-terminal cleavage/methylation domain-containing protein